MPLILNATERITAREAAGIPGNQFDVVYKIINDFNYRGNGTFVVPARGGDAITEMPPIPTERRRALFT